MKIPFIKMHGLGNDFVILDELKSSFSYETTLIKKICSRRFGIGCDQLLIIENFDQKKAKIKIFNNDGSEALACGNGVRCLGSYLMEKNNIDTIKISTIANSLECWKDGKFISVNMGKPKFKSKEIPLAKNINKVDLDLEGYKIQCVSIGNPHGIIFFNTLKELESVNILELGPKIEQNPIFPKGINIEFVTILDNGSIRMKVWERGVGMTLACGSGACAALVVANKLKLSGRKNKVILDGGELIINWLKNNNLIMTGPVAKVFKGKFNVD